MKTIILYYYMSPYDKRIKIHKELTVNKVLTKELALHEIWQIEKYITIYIEKLIWK